MTNEYSKRVTSTYHLGNCGQGDKNCYFLAKLIFVEDLFTN